MKIKELLNEGMTFGPAEMRDYTDEKGEKRILMTGERWWKKVNRGACEACSGAGKITDRNNNPTSCPYCLGTGIDTDTVSTAPELQVSNANGYAIQEMLGLDPYYSGMIDNKDLPEVMRKLLRLKNKGSAEYTVEPSTSRGPARATKDEQGMSRISTGPTVHDYGRSQEQVDRYVDRLIELVKFAQANDAHINWG
jgi:hypothetical protein